MSVHDEDLLHGQPQTSFCAVGLASYRKSPSFRPIRLGPSWALASPFPYPFSEVIYFISGLRDGPIAPAWAATYACV